MASEKGYNSVCMEYIHSGKDIYINEITTSVVLCFISKMRYCHTAQSRWVRMNRRITEDQDFILNVLVWDNPPG